MKTLLAFCFIVMFITGRGQQQALLLTAFTQSYAEENTGNYSAAIKTLKSVYNEDNYEVNLRIGYLHYMAGLFTESLTYYQRCIALMPYAIEARMGLVLPAAALGNWSMVENEYKKILVTDPQNSIANYRMGLLLYGRKEYTSAYPYFEKVVNLYPFGYDALLMFAWTHLQLGKYREAKVLFQKVLLYSPGDASALEGISLIK